MDRLIDRLFNDPKRKLVNFNVFPGENWDNCTSEERAKAINDALDQVDRGESVLVTNIDGDMERKDVREWVKEIDR